MGNSLKIMAMAASSVIALAAGASAATCRIDAVTLTEVDSAAFGPVNSTNCFGAESGNLNPTEVLAGLTNDDFGFGSYSWSYLGKDDGGSTGSVQADVGSTTGSWSADFGSGFTASVFSVLLKAGNAYSVFLFDITPSTGSAFAGTFDTQLAGLVNGGGTGQDLSHLEVAGVFTGAPPSPIPLPAAGWMLLAGIGGIAALKRRRKARA